MRATVSLINISVFQKKSSSSPIGGKEPNINTHSPASREDKRAAGCRPMPWADGVLP